MLIDNAANIKHTIIRASVHTALEIIQNYFFEFSDTTEISANELLQQLCGEMYNRVP